MNTIEECTLHSPLQKANKAEPTLALNPRKNVTRNPKQGYQWPPKKDMCVHQKLKKHLCFGFLVTSPLGFKARVGSALLNFAALSECNVHSLRSTSGAAPTSASQPLTSPHASAEVGLGSDLNGQSPGQKTNKLVDLPFNWLQHDLLCTH